MWNVHIAFGSDDDADLGLVALLRARGHEVDIALPLGSAWPDVGRVVGEQVVTGAADTGIVCCWTGTGVSIAANKVPGVRAALCRDAETAEGARKWNDANVLALSLQSTPPEEAASIVEAFLRTPVDESERANIERLP